MLGKFAAPLTKVAAPLHKNVLAPLVTMEISFCNRWCSLKEIQGRGVLRAGKGSILVIFTEDMGVIIKIIKLQENLGILFDGVSETVKHEIKWQEGGSHDMLIGTLEASKLRDMLTRKGVIRAKKCVARAGRGYNNMDQMEKKLVLRHPLINIEITSISTMNLAMISKNKLSFIIYWQKYRIVPWFFQNLVYSSGNIKQNQRQIHQAQHV